MSSHFLHHLLRGILLSFSWCYDGVTRLRNWAFDNSLLPTRRFDIPIIGVGNLAVGGTGKTPHTQWIVEQLLQMNYRVAVLSRGYGRKTKGSATLRLQVLQTKWEMSLSNSFDTLRNTII